MPPGGFFSRTPELISTADHIAAVQYSTSITSMRPTACYIGIAQAPPGDFCACNQRLCLDVQ